MSQNNNDKAEFEFRIMNTDPRENAPEYVLSTIQEIFDILTVENMDRFFEEFKVAMSASVHMRDAVIAEAIKTDPSLKDVPVNQLLQMPSFKWIDDIKKDQ